VTQPAVPERQPDEPNRSSLRASDADRQAVVDRLRRAHDEGRLDLAEFDDRTRAAYAARTYAELAVVTSDLPAATASNVPPGQPSDRQPLSRGSGIPREGMAWRIAGSMWFFASFLNLVIWAIVCIGSMEWVYPWWIWVAGPWGAVLLFRWLSCRASGTA
jgi:hypothetical protein